MSRLLYLSLDEICSNLLTFLKFRKQHGAAIVALRKGMGLMGRSNRRVEGSQSLWDRRDQWGRGGSPSAGWIKGPLNSEKRHASLRRR